MTSRAYPITRALTAAWEESAFFHRLYREECAKYNALHNEYLDLLMTKSDPALMARVRKLQQQVADLEALVAHMRREREAA